MTANYRPLVQSEPILVAAEMRAAEAAAVVTGIADRELMERAGRGAADAIAAYCGPAPVLILAGPGNNGGDGYVVARLLHDAGWPVRVAALCAPTTESARAAAAEWKGATETIGDAKPARILVDALFGTGLRRGLDPALAARVHELARDAIVVALDVPSGAQSDDGACLSALPRADLTVAFGALKPAHLLQPAAASMGRVVVADIGLTEIESPLVRNGPPNVPPPDAAAHKYLRGHVLVVAGTMPGAAYLAARAAQRAGAGYVTLAAETPMPPSSLVVQPLEDVDLSRIGSLVLGPGLGRTKGAKERARSALSGAYPAVIDADLFHLFADEPGAVCGGNRVLTPHEGEFRRFFGDLPGSKVDRARAAAARSGSVVVLKGADTVIAEPGGRAAINDHTSPRLATAGSGDVLSGIIAALLARGMPAFEAACAGVWLHGDAALRGRDGLVAEDLIDCIR